MVGFRIPLAEFGFQSRGFRIPYYMGRIMDYHIFDGMFPISIAQSRSDIFVVISSLAISTVKMTLCKNLEIGHFLATL